MTGKRGKRRRRIKRGEVEGGQLVERANGEGGWLVRREDGEGKVG
jgi:hypothetical protein